MSPRRIGVALVAAALLALAAAGLRLVRELRPAALDQVGAFDDSPAAVARGAALALAGNCAGCHTAPGGAPYAGGRGIGTPFGTVYAGNLTPDPQHGLGRWTPAEFRRAMRHGQGRDGRLLAPVFPYPNFTLVSDADNDALFAYLRSQPPAPTPNRPHALRFPYGTPLALAAWRLRYFRAGPFEPDPSRDAAWNRGAYLVQGLGHCNACHAGRDAFGGTGGLADLSGGPIPQQRWVAPPLGGLPRDEVAALLGTGMAAGGAALGPMAEVVATSTQHLPRAELEAIGRYIESQPAAPARDATPARAADPAAWRLGEALYGKLCADCHGPEGQGAEGAVAALAGNRTVRMASPANTIRAILEGGFAPATTANPRPHGMPPFAARLSDAEVAAVAGYVRGAWGNAAGAVGAIEVLRQR